MKKIFLCSSFRDVASLFEGVLGSDVLRGKRVTFIPTASFTEKVTFYVGAARKALEKMGMFVDELDISTASSEEIIAKLHVNDFIYVTGGNTFFLLQELKNSGADKLIREEVLSGKVYVGESAGAIILSPHVGYVTEMDSLKHTPELQDFSALELVDFYTVPHYKNYPFVGITKKIVSLYQHKLPLYPISNTQAIYVEKEEIKVITTGL